LRLREQSRMAAIGALQGFVLWLLRTRWPSAPQAAAVYMALVFFVIVSALVLHFARTGRDSTRLLALAQPRERAASKIPTHAVASANES
jgi:hypothetical protein